MGKGDKRSRRGKIFAGSFGKTRPKSKKKSVAVKPAVESKPAKKKGK
ncbi:MAG: 30S ribosomal protein THX [Blastocatellia bacterium]|nr:30S ribosomal protein THX [Chloracidobacterium sp.]MBL8184524.1 30S ribosomal protein THX [Blastocatellia bacterium]HBE84019.1 30S ribosomal protein THX [Blastocatellia bacterium]